MEVASQCKVSILDEGGETFEHIWCGFELTLTFNTTKDETGYVYTAKKHKYEFYKEEEQQRQALGILIGDALIEQRDTRFSTARNKEFPLKLIAQAPSSLIELVEALENLNRIHILNSIYFDQINRTPLIKH